MGGQAGLDVLHLEGLVEPGDDFHRLRPRHLDPFEGLVGGDDLLHLGLDGRQVLVGDGAAGPHVVVEALADGGAEGEFHALEESHHGPGHNVGCRVPHHAEAARVTGEDRLDGGGAFGWERSVEAGDGTVEQGGDGPLFAGGRGVGGGLGEPGAGWVVAGGAVGEADVRHGWNRSG